MQQQRRVRVECNFPLTTASTLPMVSSLMGTLDLEDKGLRMRETFAALATSHIVTFRCVFGGMP